MLMAAATVGRPRKFGERYPSGDLKPAKAPNALPMSSAQWARIRQHGRAFSLDERFWRSEVGRLNATAELTNAQAVAGIRIAEIYGAFEKLNGLRRHTHSPSYEMSFRVTGLGDNAGGLIPGADDKLIAAMMVDMGDDEKVGFIARLNAERDKNNEIKKNFLALRDIIPREYRSITEMVCVENQPISPVHYPMLRAVLNAVSTYFSSLKRKPGSGSGHGRRERAHVPLHFNAHEAAPTASGPTPRNLDRAIWKASMRRMRPDLMDGELNAEWELMQAQRDRDTFNRSKRKASKQ